MQKKKAQELIFIITKKKKAVMSLSFTLKKNNL